MANQQIIEVKQTGAEKAARGIDKVDRSIGGLTSSALKYAAAAGAIIAVTKKAIDAYGIQEQAEKRLEVATGRNIDALKRQAAALQQVTTFGDEMILGVQASIAAFVDDEEAIKKATAATLDLAAATGMDLKSAGDLVAKSLGSSTNALSRYGIEVTGAVGSTERLDTLVGNIADKFDGQAAAAAETMAGSIQQAKNAMGDAAESIGGLLAPAVTQIARGFKFAAEQAGAFFDLMKGPEIDTSIEKKSVRMAKLATNTFFFRMETKRIAEALAEQSKQFDDLAEKERIESEQSASVRESHNLMNGIMQEGTIPLLQEMNLAQNDLSFSNKEFANFMVQTYAPAIGAAFTETAGLLATLAGEDYGRQLQAMRLAQFGAIASTAAGAAKAFQQGGVLGFAGAAAVTAAGLAQVATIQNAIGSARAASRSAATEMDEVITRPTYIRVGDQPGSLGERVTVSHAGGSPQGGGGVNITFNGNVTDREYVRGFIIPEIQKAMRLNA